MGNRNGGLNPDRSLNIEALVNMKLERLLEPVRQNEERVVVQNEKIVALGQLQSIVNTLQTCLDTIRGYAFGESSTDSLNGRKVSITSSAVSDASSFFNVSLDQSIAELSSNSFTIEVQKLAKNQIMQSVGFASISASATNLAGDHTNTALLTPGTFYLNGQSVTVSDGDSIQTFARKLNSISAATNVTAQIVNPSLNNYVMILESSVMGAGSAITFTDVDNVLNGVFSSPNAVLQSAQDAVMIYNNSITVTKPTNTITDFIPGVTFELFAETFYGNPPAQFKANVALEYDIEAAVTGVKNFVSNYNSIVKYITQQQAKDESGMYLESAKIRNDTYISNILADLKSIAGNIAYVNSSAYRIGVDYLDEVPANPSTQEPEYNGLLSIDETALRSALSSNFTTTVNLFRFNISGDTTNLMVYKRGQNITNQSIVIDVDITRPSTDIVRVTSGTSTTNMTFTPANPSDLTQGGTIRGISGSLMDGYVFGYTGLGVETKSINISQGVADKMYERLREVSSQTASTGQTVIMNEVSGLTSQVMDTRSQISEKIGRIEEYRQSLIERYSKLEAKRSKAEMMTMFIKEQTEFLTKK